MDIQLTERKLIDKGVTVDIHGLGPVRRGRGELIVAVLAQVANMERENIIARTAAGRKMAVASLAATGETHRRQRKYGKASEGRQVSGVGVARGEQREH